MSDTTPTEFDVEIERFADQGRCVAHVEGRVVFVRFALPGEKVRIRLDEPHDREDRFWTGEVTEVLEASDDRVEPAWTLAGPLAWGGGVGGADLVHASLPAQLAWKKAVIDDQMKRMGGIETDVEVVRVAGDDEARGLGWRTRIELVADDEGFASMRQRGSHTRVRLDSMPLATESLAKVADEVGLWKGGFEPGARLRLAVPEPRDGQSVGSNFAFLVDSELRAGSPRLTETVLSNAGESTTYSIRNDSFWQVHRQAPQELVGEVLEAYEQAGTPKTVWDLYSGSGLFTVALAERAGRGGKGIMSIEGAKEAVASASKNLESQGYEKVVVRQGDVSRSLRTVLDRVAHPNFILLDPPRAGAKKNVSQQMAYTHADTIAYVSCDPTSLARDTRTLTDNGYELTSIKAFDIYPMTHHVETLAIFKDVSPRRS